MLVYPSGVDVSSSSLRSLSTLSAAAPSCDRLPLAASEPRPPGPARTRSPADGTHVCPARGRIRYRNHDRLLVCHRGCRTHGSPRAHPGRCDPGRVDEGLRDPRRHTPADRPHRRGPALLLRETQEARDEPAGPHGSLRPAAVGLAGPARRRPRCPRGPRADIMPGSSSPSHHFSMRGSSWRRTGRRPAAARTGRYWAHVPGAAVPSATQSSCSRQVPSLVSVTSEPDGRLRSSLLPVGSVDSAVSGLERVVMRAKVPSPTDRPQPRPGSRLKTRL